MKPTTRHVLATGVLLLAAMASRAVAAPVFESTFKKRALAESLFALEIWASDPQGHAMAISASNLPPGAVFTPHSIGGVLHYVPTTAEVGTTYTCRFYTVSASGTAEMSVPIQVVGSEAELEPYRALQYALDVCGRRLAGATYRTDTAGGQGQPVGWTAGGIWRNSGGFLLPDAVPATNRLIVATASGNGGIAPSGTVWVAHGAGQSFSFVPDEYYYVSDVEVDGVSVGATNGYAFAAVISNRTIHAMFAAHCTSQGVPWWWLALHGLTNQPWETAALLDHGCGRPAWEAWVAGIDPANPAMAFEVTEARREVVRMQMAVRTVPGRIYAFRGTTNLWTPDWQPAEYSLTAEGILTNGTLTATGAECVIYVPQEERLFFVRPEVRRPEE